MLDILEVESTLTDRFQTTVPGTVRRALHLRKRDKIHYTIRPDGEVVLKRLVASESDPVLGHFLGFLASDMSHNPEHLKPISQDFIRRIKGLTKGIEINLDAALSASDE
jgi:antitoxin PrlF